MLCIGRTLPATAMHCLLVLGSAGLLACRVWGTSHMAMECLMPHSRQGQRDLEPRPGFAACFAAVVPSATSPRSPTIPGEI